MKRFSLFLSLLFLCVCFLSSCIKGGNIQEFSTFGVLKYSEKGLFTPVLETPVGIFYSPVINSLMGREEMIIDHCYAVYIQLDHDLPENSSTAYDAYGYQTVTIKAYEEVPRYNLEYLPEIDLTTILPAEVPVSKGFETGDYVSDYLFMLHYINIQDDWSLNWKLSCNSSKMYTEEDGKRYYNLYLRATVNKEGDKTVKVEKGFANAYRLYSFLTSVAVSEKTLLGGNYVENSSKFNLRFNYVSQIDTTSQTLTWKHDQLDAYIAPFIPKLVK